jgi:hypothetical protein
VEQGILCVVCNASLPLLKPLLVLGSTTATTIAITSTALALLCYYFYQCCCHNTPTQVWEKSFQRMNIAADRKYDSIFVEKDGDGRGSRSAAFSVSEARTVLREAAKRRGRRIASYRVQQACAFVQQRWFEAAAATRRAAAETAGDISSTSSRTDSSNSDSSATAMNGAAAAATAGAGTATLSRQLMVSIGSKLRSSNSTSNTPLGGAGLEALMGSTDSLQQRLQGKWLLSVRTQKGSSSSIEYPREGATVMHLQAGGLAQCSAAVALISR